MNNAAVQSFNKDETQFKKNLRMRRRLKRIYKVIPVKKVDMHNVKPVLDTYASRLDVVVWSMGLASTITESRQKILHRKVTVNNDIETNIGRLVKKYDLISLRDTRIRRLKKIKVSARYIVDFSIKRGIIVK